MPRSHVLLHCPNAKLRAAREEAWESKDPGSIRVLLSNPRWERRLLRFPELSGVGRVVEEWDRCGRSLGHGDGRVGGRGEGGAQFDVLFLFLSTFVKGDSYPELCVQQRDAEDRRISSLFLRCSHGGVSYVCWSAYPLGMNGPL